MAKNKYNITTQNKETILTIEAGIVSEEELAQADGLEKAISITTPYTNKNVNRYVIDFSHLYDYGWEAEAAFKAWLEAKIAEQEIDLSYDNTLKCGDAVIIRKGAFSFRGYQFKKDTPAILLENKFDENCYVKVGIRSDRGDYIIAYPSVLIADLRSIDALP